MLDPFILAVIIGTFLIAGMIKGVVGLGLPTVSLGILTVAIDLPTAMALLLIPSFVTNIWQATVGGNGKHILLCIWPFLMTATFTVWLGALALTRIDLWLLSGLLGGLLVIYAAVYLAGFHLVLTPRQQIWAGPLIGTVNGILTGMTGSFAVPGVMFLQAVGLPRDMLIQAMGMLFTLSTLALAFALHGNNLLTNQLGILSLISLPPAAVGMVMGQKIRLRLPEQHFKHLFFIALLILGLFIIGNAIISPE